MTRIVPLSRFMPYGAPDLLAAEPTHLLRALLASSALAVVLFAAVGALAPPAAPPRTAPTPRYDPRVLEPPPVVPAPPSAPPEVRPAPADRGAFEPARDVPDEVVDPVPPAPSAAGESGSRAGPPAPPEAGNGILPEPDAYPAPDSLVMADELPEPLVEAHPEYSELARQAGAEGLVVVRVLVGRDGRVARAFVDPRFSVPLLDGVALDAARRWIFRPALVHRRPVAVWVALRFRFRLR